MSSSKFFLNTQTIYGIGWSRNLGEFLIEQKFGNVVILVDEGVKNHSPYYEEIIQIIASNSRQLHIEVLRGTEEPDYDYLDAIADKIRSLSQPNVLIGIGGGSCLDITKAVAVLQTNPGRGIEFRGFDQVSKIGIPTIAIPTTAGTGSEVTINAVFTDKKEMKKLGINGRYMNATYAILDAEWTLSCPDHVAVSSGMDAMVHALESFMCKQASPLTRVFSREAFMNLYQALPCLVEDFENKEKRQQLLLGSYLAATALFNSGSGISGALSYPLGVHYKIPHGIGGGIFIVSVLEYNVKQGYQNYAELFDLVAIDEDLSVEAKNERFVEMLRGLCEKLNVPRHLSQWGITSQNIDEVAMLMLPLQPAFDQNPVPFSAETDVLGMLEKARDLINPKEQAMKYKSCTEYWLDPDTCTFRGEFEQMYREIDDPWACQANKDSLNNRIYLEVLFENRCFERLLDVGCGFGGLTKLFVEQNDGGEVIGCDISKTAVNKARMLYPELNFTCLDVLKEHPKRLGSFDLISLSELLWYILDDLEGVFKKIDDVLKPAGVLGIHQYFPADQHFGKDIISSLSGFEAFMSKKTAFKPEKKVISYVEDGLVLLATYRRGE